MSVMLRLAAALGGLSLAHAAVQLQSGFVLEDAAAEAQTVISTVYYSATRQDNIVGATAAIKAFAVAAKANTIGPGARFLAEAAPGAVPLKSFYSEKLQDTLTVASREGLAWAEDALNGYKFMQIEGYCFPTEPVGGGAAMMQYWSAARNDSFLVVVHSSNEATARSAKYVKQRVECWAPPPSSCRAGTDCGGTGKWTTWEDKPPTPSYTNPGTIPFPKSKDLLGWESKSGANPGYGGGNHVARSADTWCVSQALCVPTARAGADSNWLALPRRLIAC
jgi:hypothetical protein